MSSLEKMRMGLGIFEHFLIETSFYLGKNPNFGCKDFAFLLGNKPVAFIALVHSPYKKKYCRVSPLVVLPDYQGIGIGTKLLN